MIVDLDLFSVGLSLVVYSFVQGLGYAVASWFFQRKAEKHFNRIEDRLSALRRNGQ